MKPKIIKNIGPFLGLVLFGLMLWVLRHELRAYHYWDVIHHLGSISASRLTLALLLTLLNYLVLTGHDALAFRFLHAPLSYGKIALASFLGYAFSHSIGFAMLSSISVRYRLYAAWGLSAGQIATVVAFNGITFWCGVLIIGGCAFIWEPLLLPGALHLPFASLQPLGVLFLALALVYLTVCAVRKTPLTIRAWQIPVPPLPLALVQVLFSSLDWALAAGVLYVLLPAKLSISYSMFLGLFVLAQLVGVGSQVPGGLGVVETIVLVALRPMLPAPVILGVLVVYRVIYYLLPLALAIILLAVHECIHRQSMFSRWVRVVGLWAPALAPQFLALSTFLGGVVLLGSGALPAVHSRLAWLHHLFPLPMIELSHFLGSLVGLGLLILARGVQQRLNVAYHLTILLLIAGSTFSLLKGFDYEEAIILSSMLAVLLPCRRAFYRQTSFLSERFTVGWVLAIVAVLMGSIWLGMFVHRHVEYSHELWWHFALAGDASRFLRATVGALAGVLICAATRLLRPAPPNPTVPDQDDFARAQAVIAQARETQANLALLGDKALLFNDSGTAFIMYAVEGRSWIALGDPVGPERERTELAWRFCELCDYYNDWPVFYEVQQQNLSLYVDLGLSLLKLGEEARVRLDAFSLSGEAGKKFRHTLNRMEKAGGTFAVVPAADVPSILPELRAVSNAWLGAKRTREKGFSLGRFDDRYLARFPVATVWQAGNLIAFANLWLGAEKAELSQRTREKGFSLGRFDDRYLARFPVATVWQAGNLIAFANLWLGAEKAELSPDLMRYVPDASASIMDYLLLRLMVWGKQEGYQWFNLGMAPLSGLEDRTLVPFWNRLGAFVFRHGEHFYNFQGLRQYKEKFGPVWEAKYLAVPGGLALPRILTNLATCISGGVRGVISK